MSEVPLYSWECSMQSGPALSRALIQGYLAHKKQHPFKTLR